MFNTDQIIPATVLIRKFKHISKYLYRNPQALLITQKSKEHLVVVNAEIFEELITCKMKLKGIDRPVGYLKEMLEAESR